MRALARCIIGKPDNHLVNRVGSYRSWKVMEFDHLTGTGKVFSSEHAFPSKF